MSRTRRITASGSAIGLSLGSFVLGSALVLAGACSSSSTSSGTGGHEEGTGGATGVGGAATGGAGGGLGGSAGGAGSGGRVGTGGAAAGGTTGGVGGSGGSGGNGGLTGIGGAVPGGTGGAISGGTGGFGISGPSRCATAGVPLCESFENGLDNTLWPTITGGDGTAVVDSLHAARGTKALHVKSSGMGSFAYIQETRTFPATNNLLFGRMFLWFDDDITTDGHFSLAEGAGTGTAGVVRFGGQFKEFGVGSDHGNSGDWTDHDSLKIPSKTWICAEFEFKGDTNEFRVWWDDVERTALRSGPAQHSGFIMPAFTQLWFGWWMYNISEPQDVWIDEIAVDYKPIGCTK